MYSKKKNSLKNVMIIMHINLVKNGLGGYLIFTVIIMQRVQIDMVKYHI